MIEAGDATGDAAARDSPRSDAAMHVVDWSFSPLNAAPSTPAAPAAADRSNVIDFRRRAVALRRIERAVALTPVPAEYFDAGNNRDEDDWWAKQLGRR
jgi:hypothetical protein